MSFTFHEQDDDITNELNKLNNKLDKLQYTNMIHMADLIMRRGDYKNFDIKLRKSIFNSIYQFSRRISVKYCSIIIDKRYVNIGTQLRQKLAFEINKLIKEHINYFNKFYLQTKPSAPISCSLIFKANFMTEDEMVGWHHPLLWT